MEELHLYGVTCIFISSKVEDVKPITFNQILRDAAFDVFTREQIIETELYIIQTLHCRLLLPTWQTPVECAYTRVMEYCMGSIPSQQPNYITPDSTIV